MSIAHDKRVAKAKATQHTLTGFEKLRTTLKNTKAPGRKLNLSRNEKLDRFQRNLSGITTDVGMYPKDVILSGGKARNEGWFLNNKDITGRGRPDIFIG